MSVENKTKKMTITKNGNVIKTMPVSLGKPSMPSSSGNLVIMDKRSEMMFDSSTFGIPADSPGGYRTKVHYAMRLTWGGEFIHAAPWSVGDQGHRNVSHGCVNVSMDNARYIYNLVHVGDPVTVKHTEKHVGNGDGWTAWDMSWEDFKAGSALN
jgi:lipoprotein-anchoring transpeptidase ErfK/SrfK